jgi:hypothetical protein
MNRRRFERHVMAGKVQVERRTRGGNTAVMSVFLREMSVGGFSGTYVGPSLPHPGETLTWRHDDGEATPLRMVWTNKSLECIHLVGFEVLPGNTGPVAY